MARYAFDLESDGLLDELTTIHSLVLQDVDTGEMLSAANKGDDRFVVNMLQLLEDADQIIGHNIINFDIPAIQKIYPWFQPNEDKVFDTLIMSRLIWTNLMDLDAKAVRKGRLPPRLRGSHGLEAWGYRLGEWKGDYSKEMKEKGLDPWAEWNQSMQTYCEQDVVVTDKLLKLIEEKNTDPRAIEMEHRVAFIVSEQQRMGFVFDYEASLDLLKDLQIERADVEGMLQSLFDPWYSFDKSVLPKRTVNYKDLTRSSTWAGAPYSKVKLNVFNPGSRVHISDRLMKIRGWRPSEFTANGQPKVDDEILSNLPYPEAQQIAYYLMLQKRLGQLYEGRNSWINKFNKDTGRIHGGVVTNGAVTGRMTHSNPNVAQTPSVNAPYGKECRALWTVPAGKKLVGVDVSGLELRMLAHFMAPHDGGEYGRVVVDGDIHTVNMQAAGLTERNQAKTFIYAFLYGAGNVKIGSIVGKGARHGGYLKQRFLDQTPALNELIRGISRKAKTQGYLKGLDGRNLHIRHQHAALNTLLQSAGALVCKRWAVEMDAELRERGLRPARRFNPYHDDRSDWQAAVVANIHDEHQYEVNTEIAEEVGELSIECIKRSGEYFNIRLDLDGDANVGDNWKETH